MTNDQIEKAKEFATRKFAEIGKKNHFLDVFNIMKDEFGVTNEEVLIAGLLHDTLEDTKTTYGEIVTNFSEKVANLVDEVSHPKDYNQKQKEEYYEKIKTISPEAKFIKLADFASHLRTFIKIYERGEQKLYPKFINNDKYIKSIREFLDSCEKSAGTEIVSDLVNKLEILF